jgi:sugar phosphate isomerase/epimerase
MITRRKAFSLMALGAASAQLPFAQVSGRNAGTHAAGSTFKFCLNTSTIRGEERDLLANLEIASGAGYDGVEIWIRDLKSCVEKGNSITTVRNRITELGIEVVSAIGFAPWLAPGNEGFEQMKQEMELLAQIGCRRVAAPPAGLDPEIPLDLFEAGEKYRQLLQLGRETGVMPQLEFWGASPVLWHMGQVLMIASVASDPDVKILPDVYHMFRGGSGFDTLKMLNGNLIDLFHMNDYPGNIPREEQNDADRVYPGDGAAPMQKIMADLSLMGGEKILSLELFNRTYWKEEPLQVAETGLRKMRSLVESLT